MTIRKYPVDLAVWFPMENISLGFLSSNEILLPLQYDQQFFVTSIHNCTMKFASLCFLIRCKVYLILHVLFWGGLAQQFPNGLTPFICRLAEENLLLGRSENVLKIFCIPSSSDSLSSASSIAYFPSANSQNNFKAFFLGFASVFNSDFNRFLHKHTIWIFALRFDVS